MNYQDFLLKKTVYAKDNLGILVNEHELNSNLFDFQKKLVSWSLAKGKSALFANTGMGKSIIQLEWANQVCRFTSGRVLVLAPLSVAKQSVAEGVKFNIQVNYCESKCDVVPGINITNYEKLHHFENSFDGIVLDESSILKGFQSKYRLWLTEFAKTISYRLCCTATPAPNDYTEIGTHAEFLGVCNRNEMLSIFFTHDSGETSKWILKEHGKNNFYKWMTTWAVMLRSPSDIGYDASRYALPALHKKAHIVSTTNLDLQQTLTNKSVFVPKSMTLTQRRNARRDSLYERVEVAAKLASSNDEQWLLWCGLNNESKLLTSYIPGAVEVTGSDSVHHKEQAINDFTHGKIRCLVSKSSIYGFGINLQNCRNMAFVGVSDSFESMYQAIRRCWRFGQLQEVYAHIIYSQQEGTVIENVERKERDFNIMIDQMIVNLHDFQIESLQSTVQLKYNPQVEIIVPKWLKNKYD